MIGFWATLSQNMPDFTRFGRSQREQVIGQVVALPTTVSVFAAMGVMITSATAIIYGQAIWDPVVLVGKFSSPVIVAISMFTVVVATIAVNIAANVVSPANDFANAFPRFISFKTGGLITGHPRHRHSAVETAGRPIGLHLHLAAWLFGRVGIDCRRVDRGLLDRPEAGASPRGSLPGGRRVSRMERTGDRRNRDRLRAGVGRLHRPGAEAVVRLCVVCRVLCVGCGACGACAAKLRLSKAETAESAENAEREIDFRTGYRLRDRVRQLGQRPYPRAIVSVVQTRDIQQHRLKPRCARADDIHVIQVADVKRGFLRRAGIRQRNLKEARIGFFHAFLVRIEEHVNEPGQTNAVEQVPQPAVCAFETTTRRLPLARRSTSVGTTSAGTDSHRFSWP